MALTPWEPFEEVLSWREALNRIMEDRAVGPRRFESSAQAIPIDIRETETDYVIEALLPGIKPDAIQVMAVEHLLTIRATREHEEKHEKAGQYIRREHYRGELSRTLTLPHLIDPSKVEATYEHGVLEVRIPKTAAATAKRIPIKAKESAKERIKGPAAAH
jgi:HSP20 family protein